MPEFLLELLSEEIPARMQARAAQALENLLLATFADLTPTGMQLFYGPRRIAAAATVQPATQAAQSKVLGPRLDAPEQALAGFLRKNGVEQDALSRTETHWMLRTAKPAEDAAALIAARMPDLLRRFPWPKSMRWGDASAFTWVRPLRRILCLLDSSVVPFSMRDGADDGHGLLSDDTTEGHRFLAPGPFVVASFSEWRLGLRARRVIVAAGERRALIEAGIARLAAERGLSIVPDPGLLDEVTGLVEWPVPLLGRIDPPFMDLPPEVMQVSMRVNQRYFALREANGAPAPYFAFAANIEALDGGAAIIAGNERVLRARFSDARHFWDLDRRTPLADRVAALDRVTFHAKLGSQGDRMRRLVRLAEAIAPRVGADPALAARAALLAKADLTTGMVGEFPELQGIMGGYYARHDNENPAVAQAVREHYAPKGSGDPAPSEPVAITVALADKLDQLAAFFAVGEKPGGSGDPYALRRAGLGVIRILRENELRVRLGDLVAAAFPGPPIAALSALGSIVADVVGFLMERLRVQLRADGARHDVLSAVFAAGADDDINRVLARTEAVASLLGTPDGASLLTAYRRAANILRIEEKADGPHTAPPDPARLMLPGEQALFLALDHAEPAIAAHLGAEQFGAAMSGLAALRPALDAFFDCVTVNDPDPLLRRNRLRLLARVRAAMDRVADFSCIEG